MADFKYFRHTGTGKVGQYPENFGDLFPEFVEVDSNAADCVDCWLKPDDEVNDEDFDLEFEDLTEDPDDDFPDPVVSLSDNHKDK